jgi:hypothetical protein
MAVASESETLNAIHAEALKLLKKDPPVDIAEGLKLIVSLARYKRDIRTDDERGG